MIIGFKRFALIGVGLGLLLAGCAGVRTTTARGEIPSVEYTQSLERRGFESRGVHPSVNADVPSPIVHVPIAQESETAALRHVGSVILTGEHGLNGEAVVQSPIFEGAAPDVIEYPRGQPVDDSIESSPRAMMHRNVTQGYNPDGGYAPSLVFGNPGVSASLWRESSEGADFFRDNRAWKPMDLITIVVLERSEGRKEADTSTKSESTILASITRLLGFETNDSFLAPGPDFSQGVQASTSNEYEGEGETTRRDSLQATISAMVHEVLPTGILRVEGKKILAVNNEEQVLVISGLVRPRDISADNRVESSRIAHLRVDYYGNGVVSEKQSGGWLGRIFDKVWPF